MVSGFGFLDFGWDCVGFWLNCARFWVSGDFGVGAWTFWVFGLRDFWRFGFAGFGVCV